MTNLKIGVLVGSIRQASANASLARALESLAPKSLAFQRIRIDDLPLYNPDDDASPVPQVQRLREEVRACDGILFVTPEYNRSFPGLLKNAIDHASRPYGKSAWSGKPAAVIGVSPGAAGTSMAQQHLRNVLAYLDMPTMGQPEAFLQTQAGFFDEAGAIAREDTRQFLTNWAERYGQWVGLHASASQAR